MFLSSFSDIQASDVEKERGKDMNITCTAMGISKQLDSVVWKRDNVVVSDISNQTFSVDVGTFDGNSNDQTTTLTVFADANTGDFMYSCIITANEWVEINNETVIDQKVFGMLC